MSKHWSTTQAALFTIQIRTKADVRLVYDSCKNAARSTSILSSLQITNIVIVSDYLSHDTTFVSCGQKMICNHIRTVYPAVKTIIYLSDGCTGHFKNNFSMLNLIKHYDDYQYKAEWIFYSVSGLN